MRLHEGSTERTNTAMGRNLRGDKITCGWHCERHRQDSHCAVNDSERPFYLLTASVIIIEEQRIFLGKMTILTLVVRPACPISQDTRSYKKS